MGKARSQPDVLVLGSHPCCYLASLLLRDEQIPVTHASIPEENPPDRLVVVNPKFFELDKHTAALREQMNLSPIHGLKFLSNDPEASSEYVDKNVAAYVGGYKQIRSALADRVQKEKIECISTKSIAINGVDEKGVAITINGNEMHPKLLIVGGDLPGDQRKMLGLPESWESGVMHRYTFLKCKAGKVFNASANRTMPISLDLAGQLWWGWVLPGGSSSGGSNSGGGSSGGEVQIAVSQPLESIATHPPTKLLGDWLKLLVSHGVLTSGGVKPSAIESAESMDLPLAGALAQDGVGNRTLLIGPAGGFYTACAEDIYSNCWSSLFAVEAVKKSLNQRHVQDAIGAYRSKWGATLGDYLRGPQQNLRFLLPLVYRNSVMTSRMGEAILSGASVVR